ncbi:GIY-YIG nuclease family protein [Zobellella maritima]|uniref:GIY-YIG nuclease family protein n=1 Tax=Zobellella maritima TaxID=2059725 RepID=UPI000E30382C|nr:GIY-YIG nuclease family protein [Zobellella maritima]
MNSVPDEHCQNWFIYLLRCRDGSLYAGITLDPQRRCREHNRDARRASRYVWSRRPAVLVWQQPLTDKSQALRLERRLKRLPKAHKEALLAAPEHWQGWLIGCEAE